jgi:hypothetical protein
MNDKMLVLRRSIQHDMEDIAGIYKMLERYTLDPHTEEEQLIVIGYYLHNLYNAFENIFQNIAAAFENSVDDMGRWHTHLLERMRLDVLPLRPAVINDEAYTALDELRRFRHMFRHAYSVQLDPMRLEIVLHKAILLKSLYRAQFNEFLHFLESLT